MIDSTELKIGNLVASYSEASDEIIELKAKSLRLKSGIFRYTYNSIFPIELSKEILLKYGFTIVKTPSAYGFDCNKFCEDAGYVLRGAWNGQTFYCLDILNKGTHKPIYHLHQLQNLWRCLTDTELQINLS